MAVDPKTEQSIQPGYPGVGLRNVGSYQVSGHPFITGSLMATGEEVKVSFPYVAKNLTVIASGSAASMRMHFNSTSSAGNVISGRHYISIDNDEDSVTFDTRCKEVYISCVNGGSDRGFQLLATLTNIPTSQMYELTGSGLTE